MIYDISPPITDSLAVWPGDTSLSREILCDMHEGSNLTLSTLRATVHLGAHADGPNHYGKDAPSIDERNLDYYLGKCQVVYAKVGRNTRISPNDISTPIEAERVLLRTGTYPEPKVFNEDFAALSTEFVDFLHDQGVKLVGMDTPSVDLFTSKDLESHHQILMHDMAILECLLLRDVPEGIYELIALPLKLVGFDASPVRAILRTLS